MESRSTKKALCLKILWVCYPGTSPTPALIRSDIVGFRKMLPVGDLGGTDLANMLLPSNFVMKGSINPTRDGFNPKQYLGHFHRQTSFAGKTLRLIVSKDYFSPTRA